LSEFAKLSSLKLEKINLKKVVLGTAKLLRTASRLKELNQDQFIVKVDQLEDAEIDGNSVSVSQVLWNLCTNAFEAIDNKGKIFILGDKDDRFVYLRVCNTGHIPDEIIDKMFDPYFSSKSGHHRGLGLFIVRNLVLRLNGCIWVNNFISQELGCSLAIVNLKFPQYGNDDIVSISISDDLNETRLKALLD
jgi:signal transduction histidine kinase